MLQRLVEMFVGRAVRITNSKSRAVTEGICTAIRPNPVSVHDFQIELGGKHRHHFVAETITTTSVEGPHPVFVRRKIEIIQAPGVLATEELFQLKRKDTVTLLMPGWPYESQPALSIDGIVAAVTESFIVCSIGAHNPKNMMFHRSSGINILGQDHGWLGKKSSS